VRRLTPKYKSDQRILQIEPNMLQGEQLFEVTDPVPMKTIRERDQKAVDVAVSHPGCQAESGHLSVGNHLRIDHFQVIAFDINASEAGLLHNPKVSMFLKVQVHRGWRL
jgi:hypothetical protein